VTIGQPIFDVAHLTGSTLGGGRQDHVQGVRPNDPTCAGPPVFTSAAIPVNGDGDYNSGNFTPTVTGTYLWTAAYTGDQHNKGSATACNDANESSTVEKATPTLTTNASGPVIVGQNIHDTAHLSAGFGTLGGQITFEVFAPGDTTCQTPISVPPAKPVSGANDYTSGDFTTSAVGTYRWIRALLR